MDEDAFNMSIRKFLKTVGVNGQREIEQAVRAAISAGRLDGAGTVKVKAVLAIESLGMEKEITGEISVG